MKNNTSIDMAHPLSRRQFILGTSAVLSLGALGILGACSDKGSQASTGDSDSGNNSASGTEKVTVVWLPDHSQAELSQAREAFSAAITAACGLKAEIMTSIDYNVTIEAVASGAANMAFLGAEGYVQANKKNNKVQAAFVQSDENGSLDLACYYSRICVLTENADQYKKGSSYSIDNIKDKSFSFVSATSTSGFKVPSRGIMENFGMDSSDDLLESGKFFSEVLFGGSHAGSAFNLMSGDVEVAAFNDIDTDPYFFELVSGEDNAVGSVYKVRANADTPFDAVAGKQFTIIGVAPVLNAPFVFNEDNISEEARKKIVAHFCSEAVANDPLIFFDPEDENARGLVKKTSEEMCFVEVTDSWYDPLRKI